MDTVRRLAALATLLAGETAAVGVLHRLGRLPWLRVGWEDPATWLAAVPAEDAVMAVLRVVALAGAYWLLVSTAAYTLARAARVPAAVRSVRWATLPPVRRVADRAVALVLAGSSLAVGTPALAAVTVVAPPAVTAPHILPGDPLADRAASPPADRAASAPAPAGPAPAEAPGEPAPADPAAPGPTPAGTHTVAPGDNLWAITAGALGGTATNADIHPRWLEVVAANRDRLASGDPDLIYPGEQLLLPPADAPR